MTETNAALLRAHEDRIAALEGAVAMLQAQLALLAQQQYRPPSNGLDPRWPQIGPNVSGSFGEIGQ
jgi:hypothetical protein